MRFESAMKIGFLTVTILLSLDSTFAREELPSIQRNPPKKTLNETQHVKTNLSSLTEPNFHCSGATYGYDLQLSSCRDALLQFEPSTELETFGPRDRGDFDNPLPSRSLSADGRCAFTIELYGSVADEASMQDIRTAAAILARTCILRGGGRAEGGGASGIGRNRDIVLLMTEYTPSVRCERPRGRAPSDCSDVYHSMEISYFDEHLVHEGAVVEDILVPHVVQPALQECVYTVDVAGTADRESTYHIWEAMVALDDMCARFGRIGIAYGLGRDGKVIVELNSRNTPTISNS